MLRTRSSCWSPHPIRDRADPVQPRRIAAALRRANRRNVEARADTEIRQILRAEELQRSAAVQSAYAAIVASQARIVQTLNAQIEEMAAVVDAHFGQHPDAEVYASQPGLGVILAARVLGEFGDDHIATPTPERARTTPAPPRSPRLGRRRRSCSPATHATADSATPCSNGPSAHCADHPGAVPTTSNSAPQHRPPRRPRQVANRLVGILHGCLKANTAYDEHTAWSTT